MFASYDFTGRTETTTIPNAAIATTPSYPLTLSLDTSYSNFQPQYVKSYNKSDYVLAYNFGSVEFSTFTEYFTFYMVTPTTSGLDCVIMDNVIN